MSADVISLRLAKKARARTRKDQKAEENRRRHGRTKGEKLSDFANSSRAARHLEGHKRDSET